MVAVLQLEIAPPEELAEFPVKVEPVMVAVLQLEIAPPESLAEFPVKVEPVMVAVSEFKIAPPAYELKPLKPFEFSSVELPTLFTFKV